MATELRALGPVLVLALMPGVALSEGRPLSAIDWLSDTVARQTTPARPLAPPEAPVSPPGAPETITAIPLRERNLDAVGILPRHLTGISSGFWSASTVGALNALIQHDHAETLPALRDLFLTLMLAELDAPLDADGAGAFLLIRIDRLLAMGQLDGAAALVEAAGELTPDLFRRAFDIALLLGTEQQACAQQREVPNVAPTFTARIFCLARGGDWQAADLALNTGRVLGQVTAEELALLERFIEPEAFEESEALPPPERVTPLILRIHEAIGEPVSSTALPLAFMHGDLTQANGWKARLEAGERLAAAGAITAQQLFTLYMERRPAASGGVWNRVAAVQRFDKALAAKDVLAVTGSLPAVWDRMSEMELEVAFAEHYGRNLSALPLEGAASALAFRIAMLGPGYEEAALARTPVDGSEAFLIGIARGSATAPPPPEGLARAVAAVFAPGTAPVLSPPIRQMITEGRRGEAVLIAIDKVTAGTMGDLRGVTEGLAILRRLSLESAARKAALQLMLLERRG